MVIRIGGSFFGIDNGDANDDAPEISASLSLHCGIRFPAPIQAAVAIGIEDFPVRIDFDLVIQVALGFELDRNAVPGPHVVSHE